MLARVDPVGARAGHRHGEAAGVQGATVAGGVDAEGEPAGDRQTTRGERGGEPTRRLEPARRCLPAAHHGHLRRSQSRRVSQHEQHWRRIGDVP